MDIDSPVSFTRGSDWLEPATETHRTWIYGDGISPFDICIRCCMSILTRVANDNLELSFAITPHTSTHASMLAGDGDSFCFAVCQLGKELPA